MREIFHWILGILLSHFHWFDPVTAFLFLYHFSWIFFEFCQDLVEMVMNLMFQLFWAEMWVRGHDFMIFYQIGNIVFQFHFDWILMFQLFYLNFSWMMGYDIRKILFGLQIGFNLILIGFHDFSQFCQDCWAIGA